MFLRPHGLPSLAFSSYFSSFQGAGDMKYRMIGFGKVEHHDFSSFIPFSIRLVGMSSVPLFSDPSLRNDQCLRVNLRAYSVSLRAFAIQFSFSSFCPINVIVH